MTLQTLYSDLRRVVHTFGPRYERRTGRDYPYYYYPPETPQQRERRLEQARIRQAQNQLMYLANRLPKPARTHYIVPKRIPRKG